MGACNIAAIHCCHVSLLFFAFLTLCDVRYSWRHRGSFGSAEFFVNNFQSNWDKVLKGTIVLALSSQIDWYATWPTFFNQWPDGVWPDLDLGVNIKGSVTTRWLGGGPKAVWSPFLPCSTHRHNVKNLQYWVGHVPPSPLVAEPLPIAIPHPAYATPVCNIQHKSCSQWVYVNRNLVLCYLSISQCLKSLANFNFGLVIFKNYNRFKLRYPQHHGGTMTKQLNCSGFGL